MAGSAAAAKPSAKVPPKKDQGEGGALKKKKDDPQPDDPEDDEEEGEMEDEDSDAKKAELQTDFRSAVDAKVARGMQRARAAREVAAEQPKLRERLVAAFNHQGDRLSAATPTSDEQHGELQRLQQKWDRLVAAQMERGLPRTRAVAAVAESHPNLRQRMIEAANTAQRMRY